MIRYKPGPVIFSPVHGCRKEYIFIFVWKHSLKIFCTNTYLLECKSKMGLHSKISKMGLHLLAS
jgi:hypothetical protein